MAIPNTNGPQSPARGGSSFFGNLIIAVVLFGALLAYHEFGPRQQWEYKIAAVPDVTFDQEMNRIGAEGWETVSARRASSGDLGSPNAVMSYEMIFKRPRRPAVQ